MLPRSKARCDAEGTDRQNSAIPVISLAINSSKTVLWPHLYQRSHMHDFTRMFLFYRLETEAGADNMTGIRLLEIQAQG